MSKSLEPNRYIPSGAARASINPFEVQAALEQQIDNTQQQLDMVVNTLRVKERRLTEVQAEIDRDLEQAKVAQQQQVDQIVADGKATLLEINTARSKAQGELDVLDRAIQERRLEHEGVSTELADRREDIDRAAKVITEGVIKLGSLKAEQTSVQTKIDTLIPRIQPLKESLAQAEEEIQAAQNRQGAVAAKTEQMEADFQTKKTVLERELMELAHQRVDARAGLGTELAQIQRSRDELASWEKRLQLQDKNVRVREARAAVGERLIAENTDLMRL